MIKQLFSRKEKYYSFIVIILILYAIPYFIIIINTKQTYFKMQYKIIKYFSKSNTKIKKQFPQMINFTKVINDRSNP